MNERPSDLEPDEALALLEFYELWESTAGDATREDRGFYLDRFPRHAALIAAELDALTQQAQEAACAPLGRIGPYDLAARLGSGAQGEVYRARDRRLDREVALKVLRGLAAATPEEFARFELEARTASRVDHPGICPIYDVGRHLGAPYLAMRFISGPTLARRLEGSEPPRGSELRDRVQILERVARAVQACHDNGVIHRDLKPKNVMMDGDQPVLIDFGLARSLAEHSRSLPGLIKGTLPYMAPELLGPGTASSLADPRIDVWAIGVSIYEALAAGRPFDAPTDEGTLVAVRDGTPLPLRDRNPAVDRDLAVIVATALRVDPTQRYQSAGALADDLCAWIERRPIRARPIPPWIRYYQWARREPLASTLALIAVIALMAATGIYVERSRRLSERTRSLEAERLETTRARIREASTRGDWALVHHLCEAASSSLPRNADLRRARVLSRIGLLDIAGARNELAEIVDDVASPPGSTLLLRAELTTDRFRQPDAGRDLARAALAETDLTKPDRAYAESLIATDLTTAEALLRQALAEEPAHRFALLSLGPILIVTGRTEAALDLADRAEALFPDDVYPWLLRALVAGLIGDDASAVPTVGDATKRTPVLRGALERVLATLPKDDSRYLAKLLEGTALVRRMSTITARVDSGMSFVQAMQIGALITEVRSWMSALATLGGEGERRVDILLRIHPALASYLRALVPSDLSIRHTNAAAWKPTLAAALAHHRDPVLVYGWVMVRVAEILPPTNASAIPDLREVLDACIEAAQRPSLMDVREGLQAFGISAANILLVLTEEDPNVHAPIARDARRILHAFLTGPRRNAAVYYEAFELARTLEDAATARVIAAQWLAARPKDPDAHAAEAWVPAMEDRPDVAARLLEDVVARFPRSKVARERLESLTR